ncbi:hypothetical protein H0N96_03160 [Candidatus Micrarchaeota archaeon]|nr:hypothetical protein [Candidatus Micrarchaeota archaeon]
MIEEAKARKGYLEYISSINHSLTRQLKKHSNETIKLVHDTLKMHAEHGVNDSRFAITMYFGLKQKVFTSQNLPQILPLLKTNAECGHDVENLATALFSGLQSKAFTSENLPRVLELLSKHAEELKEKGNVATLAAALLNNEFREKVLNFKEREPEKFEKLNPYLLKGGQLLHGVETTEYNKISARLFQHILETFEENPEKLESEKFWKSARLYAKQLKALSGVLK